MDSSQPTIQENNRRFDQWIAYAYSSGILYREFQRECNRRFITKVLQACNGNQCRAARELGMHRNTLSRTIAELKLDPYDWNPRRHLSGRLAAARAVASAGRTQHSIGAA